MQSLRKFLYFGDFFVVVQEYGAVLIVGHCLQNPCPSLRRNAIQEDRCLLRCVELRPHLLRELRDHR